VLANFTDTRPYPVAHDRYGAFTRGFVELPAFSAVNTSLWTMKYEVICYAVLALGGAIALRLPPARLLGAGAFCDWLAAILLSRPALLPTNGVIENVRYFMLFFGTGVLSYGLRHQLRLSLLGIVPMIGLAVVLHRMYTTAVAYVVCLAYAMLALAQFCCGWLRHYLTRYDYS
jgi:peptidoglycan/LPS O-acetylase OafA/YrhL